MARKKELYRSLSLMKKKSVSLAHKHFSALPLNSNFGYIHLNSNLRGRGSKKEMKVRDSGHGRTN